ncbi:MAG TPA: CoA synthetase, partial [Candidatus Angelobacter sp.]|nr:CoA synthetase [Candidatus Angelobacter sp.]
MVAFSPDELLICTIARMLEGLGHVAVGASSPIPGAAALLARSRSGGRLR